MRCLVLAAGYATRLYPLTENMPKPLLKVNGKAIIDWLVDDIEANIDIEQFIVVSNHKFLSHFEEWKGSKPFKDRIIIVDDGSTENDNRLGAVKDIVFAIDQTDTNDDLLVVAGDNVLDFSFKGFVDFFVQKQSTCIMRHFEDNVEKLRRTGVVLIDAESKVLEMAEKPHVPKSTWAVPPFYIYKREDLCLIKEGVSGGCDTDAPGSFISWLCTKCPVYAYEMPGKRYDVGNLETYRQVDNEYRGILK